ncbi:hypothetical protein C8F01DRAFT_1146364 [Mycena amicta]|nr:hypothetical protein C8F01DRAFT_1146364 [Mycena amicta]
MGAGSNERRRDKDKERDREKRSRETRHRERERSDRDKDRERKPRHGEDADATQISSDVLREVASTSVSGGRFAVIKGAEARQFARRFIREQTSRDQLNGNNTTDDETDTKGKGKPKPLDTWTDNDKVIRGAMQPVVFALVRSKSRIEGTKENIVHWIKAWQGKNDGRTHPLRGFQRRANFLENEFKKVQKTLDDYRRRSVAPVDSDTQQGTTLKRTPTDPQPPPQLPPLLAKLVAEHNNEHDHEDANESGPPPSRRSVSDPLPLPPSMFPPPSSFPINLERPPLGSHRGSIDSVTSLPLLGMVRGVPVGNRVPLRVTNPSDRMSTMSSSSGAGSVADAKHAGPGLGLGLGPSPLSQGMAYGVAASEGDASVHSTHSTHVVQLPIYGRTASDTSASSGGSRSSRKSGLSYGGGTSTRSEAEDGDKEKLLIVLLDENDEDVMLPEKRSLRRLSHGQAPEVETWHGLERRLSSRPASRRPTPPRSSSAHPSHPSPWLGPLMDLDEDIRYVRSRMEAEDSDDYLSDTDDRTGLVPISALVSQLQALGYGSGSSPGVSPFGSHTSLPPSSAYGGSPYAPPLAMSASAYGGSPYAPPAQLQMSSPYRPPSIYGLQLQPPSRPQTPPWPGSSTPGATVYPPTNYVNPSPAGYASPGGYSAQLASPFASSPYAHASPLPVPVPVPPLGGYGSPGPGPYGGGASPAGSYASLNQAYLQASPYHASQANVGSPYYRG